MARPDEAFKRRLLAEPGAVLRERGLDVDRARCGAGPAIRAPARGDQPARPASELYSAYSVGAFTCTDVPPASLTTIVWMLVNSRMPNSPSSRP